MTRRKIIRQANPTYFRIKIGRLACLKHVLTWRPPYRLKHLSFRAAAFFRRSAQDRRLTKRRKRNISTKAMQRLMIPRPLSAPRKYVLSHTWRQPAVRFEK